MNILLRLIKFFVEPVENRSTSIYTNGNSILSEVHDEFDETPFRSSFQSFSRLPSLSRALIYVYKYPNMCASVAWLKILDGEI